MIAEQLKVFYHDEYSIKFYKKQNLAIFELFHINTTNPISILEIQWEESETILNKDL